MKGRVTKTGYKKNSPDVKNDYNIIPSGRITMQDVEFPVYGVDNLGYAQMMYPGGEYDFPGEYVMELPVYGSGGLTQWFAEEWKDIKTGKPCGRQEGENRSYPACRPSRRVNETTPKTSSEMSAAEKQKFRKAKTSKKRIGYNHKRELGGPLTKYQVQGEVKPVVPGTSEYYNARNKNQLVPINKEGIPFGILDEVDLRVDYDQYPYYNQLSNQQKKWFLEAGKNYGKMLSGDTWQAGPMQRAARRAAAIGRDQTAMAEETFAAVNPILAGVMSIASAGALGMSGMTGLLGNALETGAANIARVPGISKGIQAAKPVTQTIGKVWNTPIPHTAFSLNTGVNTYFAGDAIFNRIPKLYNYIQDNNPSKFWGQAGIAGLDVSGLSVFKGASELKNNVKYLNEVVQDAKPTVKDVLRPKSLLKEYDAAKTAKLNSDEKVKDVLNEWGRIDQQAIDKANERYRDYDNFFERANGEMINITNKYNDFRFKTLKYNASEDRLNSTNQIYNKADILKSFDADPSKPQLNYTDATPGFINNLNPKGPIIDFQTGKTFEASIKFPNVKGVNYSIENNAITKKITSVSSSLEMPKEAQEIVSSNIKMLEKDIPGFNVMGSSRGFAEANFPSVPKDYDGVISQNNYDKYVSKKYKSLGQNGPAELHEVNINGTSTEIDFNVVRQNKNGKAEGALAEQLYRSLDPDDYYRQTEAVIDGVQKNIKIPYTPDELISKTDFTKRSIADSFEISSSKIKHISRPDAYLSYGDPQKVLESQKAYAQSLLGKDVKMPPTYDASSFSDIDANTRMLKNMGFAGDIQTVAKDPVRMQAVLNDFYFSNTVLSRGINNFSLSPGSTARDAMTTWDPVAGGGSLSGAGLNNTLLGDTGYGNIYGHKQFNLNLSSNTPEELINHLNQLNFEKNLNPEQLKAAKNTLDTYGVSSDYIQTKVDFLHRALESEKSPELLKMYADLTGEKYMVGADYAESLYAGSFNVFNPSKDLLTMGFRNPFSSGSIPVGKSWKVRGSFANQDGFNVNNTTDNWLKSLNEDEFTVLWRQVNTPGKEGLVKNLERNRFKNYEDRLLQSYRLRGEPTYQQRIDYNIKKNKAFQEQDEALKNFSDLTIRTANAEDLKRVLKFGALGIGGIGGSLGLVNAADNYSEKQNQQRLEKNASYNKELDRLKIPRETTHISKDYFEMRSVKDLDWIKDVNKKYKPMEIGERVYLVPKKQKGGEQPIQVIGRNGVRPNPDGSESTHLMAREYVDGRGWVAFPTLFQNSDSTWVDMSQDSSWYPIYEEAVKRGEVYDFGENEKAAIKFADEGSWKKEAGGQLNKYQQAGEYKVQSGDTFYGIANRQGVDKQALLDANPGLDIDNLKVGQSINLPGITGPNYALTSKGVVSMSPDMYEKSSKLSKNPVFIKAELDKLNDDELSNSSNLTVDADKLRKGLKYAESVNGTLMKNPESSATGFYGQLFSEIEGKDFLKGITRDQFAQDTVLQNRVFDERLAGNETFFGKPSGLIEDGLDLYKEYKPQLGEKLSYTPTELAALSNMLGRQGTRDYLGYVLRDGKTLAEALPKIYGPSAKYKNKTPEQYIQKFNEAFKEAGGESTPSYDKYDTLERAWFAARKDLGKGKVFMYGGEKHTTLTPKGL